MAITNYGELKTAIGNWINRSDLTSVIPDFITLAEAEIKRRLRRKLARQTVTFNAEAYDLPAVVAELRAVRLVTSSPSQDVSLMIVTPEHRAIHLAETGNSAGRPRYATVVGSQLLLAPVPDKAYDAELIYYEQLTALSDANPSNSILAEAPDLYLFGALREAELYLEHDERNPLWSVKFEAVLEQLNLAREREEFNASRGPLRLSVVF